MADDPKFEFLYAKEEVDDVEVDRCYVFVRLMDEVSGKQTPHLVDRVELPEIGPMMPDSRTKLHARFKKEADELGMCTYFPLH